MQAKKNDLLIVPIGGLEQIGANCTMIGNNKEWVVVDLGIAFYDKLGIEVLTPDTSFLSKQKDKIKGIFITHAHEDHIGAIPYLWPYLKCPIYLTEFPAAVLDQKLKDYSWGEKVKINVVSPRQPINVGSFDVEFVSLSHSILGACGLYIKTKAGTIFHTGDWKIDENPLLGDRVDVDRLVEIGKEGVDCLLCDSTNMLTESQIGSESTVRETLLRVISEHKNKRVTVTCFSSNVIRLETIFNVARKTKRKVAILGKSMYKMLEAVAETAYYTSKFKDNVNSILSDDEAMSMPPEKVLLICTGSQGESRSALYRIARGENKSITFGDRDVVIFSSKVIPGNELGIRDLQNLLTRKGVELVTTDTEKDIHVSGHPNKESVSKMYGWLRPRSLIPVHGDARMLYAQRDFALECNIPEVIIAESGDVISVSGGQLKKIDHIDVSFNAVDGGDVISLESAPIRERTTMTYNGHVCVSFLLSSENRMVSSPEITIQGINIYPEFAEKINSLVYQVISSELAKGKDDDSLRKECESSIRKLMFRHFEKKPLVVVHILKCS